MKLSFHSFSIVLCLALVAGTAFAEKVAPKVLSSAESKYPAELTNTGLSGIAEVDVLVKADGSVSAPKLAMAHHRAFGKAAMSLIETMKFQPGTVDGQPVDMMVALPFNFQAPLEQVINAAAKRVVFLPLTETVLVEKDFPAKKLKIKTPARASVPRNFAGKEINEKVRVKLVVGPDGATLNPEVIESKIKELNAPAIMAVARMQYEPPRKENKPVYVETITTVEFNNARRPAAGGGGGGGGGGDGGGGGGFGGGGEN